MKTMLEFTHMNTPIKEQLQTVQVSTSESGEKTYKHFWARRYEKRPLYEEAHLSETRTHERIPLFRRKARNRTTENAAGQKKAVEQKTKIPRKEKKKIRRQQSNVTYRKYN